MTKLPPGRASFPHWLDRIDSKPNLTKADRKLLREKSAAGMAPDEALRELLAEKLAKPGGAERYLEDLAREPLYKTHAKNRVHAVRWSQVRAMEEMTPAAFKKEYGFKKTLAKICELVAETEGAVGPLAIKKSCDLVDAAIEAGNGHEFFVADWPTRKLGKKRPRSR
jgi:hypothetical protein